MLPSSSLRLEISLNLKKARIEMGWSQKELAAQLNVIRETISSWECGKKSPDSTNLVRMIRLMPSLVELLGLSPPGF